MRLRSANRGNANNVWNVNSTGNVNNNNAYNANRCAPDYTDDSGHMDHTQYGCPGGIDAGSRKPCRKAKQYRADAVGGTGTAINGMNENIIGFDALYESAKKCKSGVLWKDSTAHYCLNDIGETLKLERQLHDGTYKPRPPMTFKVTHPKEREIKSVCFRDRVYQRSINDNVLYPAMTKSFIRDNCACQKGRGTDDARNRLKCHMQRQYRKSRTNFYVLQCDIQHYYQTMRHDVVLEKFQQKLEPEVYDRVEKILTEQYSGDTGFSPGSQMVQIAGISALDGVDHYIKEQLHIKGYIRYMDDFILLHPDKHYLEYCREQIAAELQKIGFALHPAKTRIYPVTDGIPFLGFIFRPTDTGKILMLLKSGNVRAERRKLRRMAGLAQKGELPKTKVDECYAAWKNHAAKGNTYHIIQRMDGYYKSLWEGIDYGNPEKNL